MTPPPGDGSDPVTRAGRAVLFGVSLLAIFAVALIAVAASVLGSDLTLTLRELRTARSENPQWSLSHTEIEFLRYRSELDRAQRVGPDRLDDLRLSFDILYSRLETVGTGELAAGLRTRDDFADHLASFTSFVEETATIIDRDDAAVLARLDMLSQLADRAYPNLRRMGLITLENWNSGSTERRDYLLGLLTQLLVVLGGGLLLLLIALTLLVRLSLDLQRSRDDLGRAMELTQRRARDKARFLSIMSHEIRNPLNGLLGALNLLDETQLAPDQAKAVSVMQTSGALLNDLVNRVLDPDTEESDLTVAAPRPVDIAALVRAIVESVQASARLKGLDLGVDVARAEGPPVETDPLLLAQALENLIGNALKFTDAGRIDVVATFDERTDTTVQLTLVVSDTGSGIAEERQAQIFEDYHSERSDEDPRPSGTGLGLGVVRRIVHALGGTITVTSAPGQGSAFELILPLALVERPVDAPSRGALSKGAPVGTQPRPWETTDCPVTLLVAEDVDFNRMVIERYLRDDGHRVTVVEDGTQAVASSSETAFDLLVLDVQMPVMDGVEALRRIRSGGGASAQSPAIAVTAFALDAELEALRAEGFLDVLQKPIDRSDLRHAVSRYAAAQGRA